MQPAGQQLIQAVVDLITYEQVDEERFVQGRKQYGRRDKGWAQDMSMQYRGNQPPSFGQPGQHVTLQYPTDAQAQMHLDPIRRDGERSVAASSQLEARQAAFQGTASKGNTRW